MSDKNANFNPRHRIIGAVILVVLGAIVLPMILRSPVPKIDDQVAPINASSTNAATGTKMVVSEISPSGANLTPSATTPAVSTISVSPAPVQANVVAPKEATNVKGVGINEQTASSVIKPAQNFESLSEAQKKPLVRDASETPPSAFKHVADIPQKGWFIQIGTYASEDNARKVGGKLRGFPVNFEHIRLGHSNAVRVRVGPYAKNTAAKAAQRRIQKKIGERGILLSYK